MKRFSIICLALFALSAQTSTGWVTLFDGKNLNNFNQIGTANWQIVDGAVEANSGSGFLVTKENYGDFELKAEFWTDDAGNSGIFMRCQVADKIADTLCYEANIFDKRPDPSGRTGAIVNVAKPLALVNAGGRWNTYEISMRGPRLVVTLNGIKTVDVEDTKFTSGPIALQYMAGNIKFRNVQIRKL
jgi:hypothetical protein